MTDQPDARPYSADAALDAQGLLCPLPVIRVQTQVGQMQPGQILEVLATDPGVLHDIPAWCRVHGHEFLDSDKQGRLIRLYLRVCA